MNIYHGIEDFKKLDYAVVTSGTFDGVHIGHQKILARLKEIAQRNNGETVLITFWPHPRLVLYPEQTDLKLLNTFEEKAELLREQGINHLLRIPFTKEFSNLTSEEFIRKILVETIGTRKLVIGYDHRFGKNREGSFEHLKENASIYGFEVEEIPRQDIDNVGVSSTKIRNSLLEGDVSASAELLGKPYSITGRVVKGQEIGRLIGFPTANIEVDSQHKLIPANGSYAVKVGYRNQMLKGMLNIGYRPTVNGKSRTIEVNIFDFSSDIYGETISIHFIRRIRDERKFNNINELKEQLMKDKTLAIEILND
ncbi:Riboflavin kinase / FMN adenylyltransferase [Fulvivirga imtechensis AK7]|uniref:Riboflavin biosynthesis protein n=1 Tax=Fulvivirga imtechensis AK7 TaxID=1237149 RepID=L8JIG7_9BACT|nr:bifunctional riboflavin kinase/FAD synthetase [Fulvivirga imtechensis]ELR68053.1 Riboflavin kinase / FMN adenylyltransferase [Fulvivirga imtechensis AK7]